MRRFRLEATLYRATRDNRFLDELTNDVLTGEVEANEDTRVKMAFSAELGGTNALEPHKDYVAPVLRVTYDDGRVVEGQVGLYIVLPPEEVTHYRTHSVERLDGRSVDWLLDADTFDQPYTVPAGVDYVDAAIAIIQSAGIDRVSIPRSGVLVPEPITWQPGEAKLDMANKLLEDVSYYHVWPTNTGQLTSFPYRDLATAEPARRLTCGENAELVGEIEEEKEYTSLANVIVVINEEPGDEEDIIAVRRNDNPASPISTVSLGVTIRRTERADVATQEAAEALADRLLQESMSFYRRATIRVLPDPNRSLHEVFDLDVRRGGTWEPIVTGRWWVRKWVLGMTEARPYIECDINRVERW